MIYGDRGSLDVSTEEFGQVDIIVTSSKSLDDEFPPQYGHIVGYLGNTVVLKLNKIHTKGPSSAITTSPQRIYTKDKLFIAAPNKREAGFLQRFWLDDVYFSTINQNKPYLIEPEEASPLHEKIVGCIYLKMRLMGI